MDGRAARDIPAQGWQRRGAEVEQGHVDDAVRQEAHTRRGHRPKGSSAAMGARRLTDICRRPEETDAASAGWDAAPAALEVESRLVRDAVPTLLGGLRSGG